MLLSQELTLPSGLKIPNRLVKAAMAENLAPSHDPNNKILNVYSQWAQGGWGLILTGNVQVDGSYLGSPLDVQLQTSDDPKTRELWKQWATTCQSSGTPTIVQLCHPGRQSPAGAGNRGFFAKTVAPSPIPLNFGSGIVAKAVSAVVFGSPREMTTADIELVIDQFVEASKRSFEAGFKGVELHGAHGYLLAQFHSQGTNKRTDNYGGSAAKRVALTLQIISRVRAATSPSFTIGIKFTSVDAATDKLEDVLEQIRLLTEAGIDFIEISGGTYEDPKMMGVSETSSAEKSTETAAPKQSTIERESFFLAFAETVRASFPKLVLMVTGGFRTRLGMDAALKSGGCDLVGIGRPATVFPDLPKKLILNQDVKDEEATVKLAPVKIPGVQKWIIDFAGLKMVGAGLQTKTYQDRIQIMAK